MGDELIVVSDSCGFIGAFRSIAEAKELVITRYSMVPLLVQRFPLALSGGENVWVVPYRDTNAVAFVSNDREKSIATQRALQNVGLTYPDSIDYWEQPIGRVVLAAAERLASCSRAHQIYAAGGTISEEEKKQEAAAAELIKRVVEGTAESPIDRLIRENERITFFDCVVDIIEEDGEGNAEPAEPAEVAAGNSVNPMYELTELCYQAPALSDKAPLSDVAPENAPEFAAEP